MGFNPPCHLFTLRRRSFKSNIVLSTQLLTFAFGNSADRGIIVIGSDFFLKAEKGLCKYFICLLTNLGRGTHLALSR